MVGSQDHAGVGGGELAQSTERGVGGRGSLCQLGAGDLESEAEAYVIRVDVMAGHRPKIPLGRFAVFGLQAAVLLSRRRFLTAASYRPGARYGFRADPDESDWPDLGSPDLVRTSASMPHTAGPDKALRNVYDLLAPGGLFAVVELAGFPRSLPPGCPEGAARPEGAPPRRRPAVSRPPRAPPRCRPGLILTAAGFSLEGERTVTVNIEGSRTPAVGAYVLGTLQRLRHSAMDALSTYDVAALDRLLDTDSLHSILRRDDPAVRTERTVRAACRND